MILYAITLSSNAYEPRQSPGGGTVWDVMPWEGAVDYVTDGDRYGVRYEDGTVDWLGTSPCQAFGDDVWMTHAGETEDHHQPCDHCGAEMTTW